MIKLTREKILLLHKLITESSGNNPSIRDIGSLNRALESAFSTSEGKDVYPTKEEKAAVMCYGIIS